MDVGFVGLGLMGLPMAHRLLSGGYTLHVYNRSPSKADDIVRAGAERCGSPAVVARHSAIVVTMVSTSDALEEVSMGREGILAGLAAGGIHVDCSTVAPSATKKLFASYRAEHCHFVHSPVLGSVPQATDGSLLLFVGATDEAFIKAETLLRSFGSKVWRFDRVEEATNTKLACNFFIAGMITLLAQNLVFLRRAGIDPKRFLEILAHSSLNSPMYQTKGATMVDNNFAPRFFVEHMLKDIRLLLDAAHDLGAALPTAELAQSLFDKTVERGFAKEDYSAVIKVLED